MNLEEIIKRVEDYLESRKILGFDIGDGCEVVDFLARLAWADIEALLADMDFLPKERELLFENIEETKGRLADKDLPEPERTRRLEGRRPK